MGRLLIRFAKAPASKLRAAWSKFKQLPRNLGQLVLLGLDLVLIPISIYLAYVARLGLEDVPAFDVIHLSIIALTALLTVISFLSLGLYRAVVRYMSAQATIAVLKGISISAVIYSFLCFLAHTSIPRSLPFIYCLIVFAFVGGVRFAIRMYYRRVVRRSGVLAIIYGAGEAGRMLMNTINHGHSYRGALFVDDDPALLNRTVDGIAVKHPDDLSQLVESIGARYVFLAIPSLTKARRREIIESLMHLRVHVKTIPSIEQVFEGSAWEDVLDIDIDDLLSREPIPPNPELLGSCVSGRDVMVTGAGGSIGSELTRQIAQNSPNRLILIEQSEYSLHQIERELLDLKRGQYCDFELVCLLASVQDDARLEQIFEAYNVDTIYHAAAYKHVPIVEHNILEGLKNNVIGTYNLVLMADKYNVDVFTLISTDKAVRPTNIMGASKRFAELILQAYATKGAATKYCMVRFGNVLGSSGSVVPIFREQINAGGPVTVTHKDVIRYFMTIPEAAQLVLQASAMGGEGDVFLLDMGEPVRIVELAKRMIWLMGREIKAESSPGGDIEIQFTGLRPGEKLYEELLIGDNVAGTGHPMIMRAQEDFIALAELEDLIEHLTAACETGACDVAVEVLCKAVPEYRNSPHLHDFVWDRRQQGHDQEEGNIISGEFREKEAVS